MYQRISWKESFWEKHRVKLLLILLIIIVFPIRLDGFKTETYTVEEDVFVRELVENIDCDFKLSKADTFQKVYAELGDDLRVVVEIASTMNIELEIQTREKIDVKETGNFFSYNITLNGPSLIIKLINPTLPIIGKDAELSGGMTILHEYNTTKSVIKTREVPVKIWKIWWLRYIKG